MKKPGDARRHNYKYRVTFTFLYLYKSLSSCYGSYHFHDRKLDLQFYTISVLANNLSKY